MLPDEVLGCAAVTWFGAAMGGDLQQWLPELLLAPWAILAVFLWGALWGSFANVVIHRVPRGQSVVRPRSRCPSCGQTIKGFDNIPILSYLLLRGRCRACGHPVSLRYLVVELLSGLLSVGAWMHAVHIPLIQGVDPNLIGWLLKFAFCWALLVVIFIDLDAWIIPDAIVLPMAAVGLVAGVIVPDAMEVTWDSALLAAALGYGSFAGLRWLYLRVRGIEALGLGDAKLLVMVAAFTGPLGLAFCVGAGALQGLLVAVPMVLSKRRIAAIDLHEAHGDHPELAQGDSALAQHVPFGPFLGLAALEYALFGPQIQAMFRAALGL